VIHAARRNRESKGKRFENACVVGIALPQPFDRHAVLQRLDRVVALLHRSGTLGQDVAKALAPRRHEEEPLDHHGIAPIEPEAAGVRGRDDAALK
jgi:hypothetical protein